MKRLFSFVCLILIVLGSSPAFAGNLALIEKRLIELDKLNKQAVQAAGEIPRDGSIEIGAKVKAGVPSPETDNGAGPDRFDFSKKKIISIDKKQPFTVQISASRSQQQCFRVAEMLRRTGYPAFTAPIVLKGQGLWHRIFIGSFATREEAEKIRQDLATDEISTDSMIRNMPYAVQVGAAGALESLKQLRDRLSTLEFMPYTSYAREIAGNTPQTRMLVGAYEKKQDAADLLATLRAEGLTAIVVLR